MNIDVNRLFLLFMGIVGAAVGLILVLVPHSRDFRLPPYFWVLIAMAVFESSYLLGRGGLPGRSLRWRRGLPASCWPSF